jgi:hypothetical protein
MKKLHEIIHANDSNEYVSFENYMLYINSLYTYYKDYFNCEPVAMITNITNTGGNMQIVSSNEFYDAVCEKLNVDYISEDDNYDLYAAYETINANSRMLKHFLNLNK